MADRRMQRQPPQGSEVDVGTEVAADTEPCAAQARVARPRQGKQCRVRVSAPERGSRVAAVGFGQREFVLSLFPSGAQVVIVRVDVHGVSRVEVPVSGSTLELFWSPRLG